ncbi:alpha/beta-hydrolase, partial [Aureobasidium melanogenum]
MAVLMQLACVSIFSLLLHQGHASPVSAAAVPTVTIDSGPVVGVATSPAGATATVNKYLGIPFAASPIRFAPPVKPTPWTTPFDASKYGPACIQQFNYPEATRNATIAWYNTPPPPAGESEDCLNVNIYVPGTGGEAKTVMAWIYGGDMTFGANSLNAYDGTLFAAAQDVIIVSLNYRTNGLALDWIQRNIQAFGGDPKKVTIFGESAGAASVDMLVTTHPSNPPFQAAIMESGQTSFYINPTNDPTSWVTLASALNCTSTHPGSNLTCLRDQSASTIKSTIEHLELKFGPVSDNVTNLRFPEAARLSGNIAPVPILSGTNANEGTVFSYGMTNATAVLESTFPNQTTLIDAILAAYPETGNQQVSAIRTDLTFQCPAGIVANDSRTAGFPTWRYYFNATFENTQLFPGSGVYHSSEITLVFGTYPRVNATADEAALSQYMQTSWATFARNPAGGPGWAEVPNVADLGTSGVLNTPVEAAQLDRRCGLYRGIYELSGAAAGPPSG